MSEHDRALAEAIYTAIRSDRTTDAAWAVFHESTVGHTERDRFRRMLHYVAAFVIDDVLASRQREAARTGPWQEPTRDEITWVMSERVAHLETHLGHWGRGPIAAQFHELACMRAALREMEAAPAAGADPTAARRAERERCARHIEAHAIALRDHGPTTAEGVLTATAGAQVGALLDAAADVRAGRWGDYQEEDGYPGSLLPRKRGVP